MSETTPPSAEPTPATTPPPVAEKTLTLRRPHLIGAGIVAVVLLAATFAGGTIYGQERTKQEMRDAVAKAFGGGGAAAPNRSDTNVGEQPEDTGEGPAYEVREGDFAKVMNNTIFAQVKVVECRRTLTKNMSNPNYQGEPDVPSRIDRPAASGKKFCLVMVAAGNNSSAPLQVPTPGRVQVEVNGQKQWWANHSEAETQFNEHVVGKMIQPKESGQVWGVWEVPEAAKVIAVGYPRATVFEKDEAAKLLVSPRG